MTNDEAGNRVQLFLMEALTNFLTLTNSTVGEDTEQSQRAPAVGAFISSVVHNLSSGELGQAMEILVEAHKPVPDGKDNGDIKAWVNSVLEGPGGLKSYHRHELGGSRANIHDAASWVIRCLANPRCAGSGSVNQAIMNERARKLGLPQDDLEVQIAGGVLDDKMAPRSS